MRKRLIASLSSNASLTGSSETSFSCLVERWVSGSKARIDSSVSPNMSRRTGSSEPGGNTSITPPRMANSPFSDTVEARL